MNYRHDYHAGNFADVLKHAVLALVIEHLKQKPAPFRVIDTHAGAGLYDLGGSEAEKTGEWRNGIGRLLNARLPAVLQPSLAAYLGAVAAENDGGELHLYPGSPRIARSLIRPVDHLIANELHPEDFRRLKQLFAGDPRVKVLNLDGWVALKSLLPPKERRGVVLVDPPFEEPDEFGRLTRGLASAAKRFAGGIILLWYPIKDRAAVARFHRDLQDLGLAKLLAVELMIRAQRRTDELVGTGLVMLNPPFLLDARLAQLVPSLAETLAQGAGASCRVEWLTGESVKSL